MITTAHHTKKNFTRDMQVHIQTRGKWFSQSALWLICFHCRKQIPFQVRENLKTYYIILNIHTGRERANNTEIDATICTVLHRHFIALKLTRANFQELHCPCSCSCSSKTRHSTSDSAFFYIDYIEQKNLVYYEKLYTTLVYHLGKEGKINEWKRGVWRV